MNYERYRVCSSLLKVMLYSLSYTYYVVETVPKCFFMNHNKFSKYNFTSLYYFFVVQYINLSTICQSMS